MTSLLDELECARLTIAWGYHLDHHEIDRILALFDDDCVLHSQTGVDAAGAEAIREVLARRSSNRVTRHVLAAPFIQSTAPDEASGVVAFTVFDGFKDQHTGSGPMPLLPAVTVGEFHLTYRRTPKGWRIATARSVAVFKKQ